MLSKACRAHRRHPEGPLSRPLLAAGAPLPLLRGLSRMPHSQRGLESGLASEGVEAAGVPGPRSQVTWAAHSRVFVSATPPPSESTGRTGHDRAHRAPRHSSVATRFSAQGKGSGARTRTFSNSRNAGGLGHPGSSVAATGEKLGSSGNPECPLTARAVGENTQTTPLWPSRGHLKIPCVGK